VHCCRKLSLSPQPYPLVSCIESENLSPLGLQLLLCFPPPNSLVAGFCSPIFTDICKTPMAPIIAASCFQPGSQLALVSSLYGPGTMICWYLTVLAVLISWTMHPRKRKSGSIDVDLVAVCTLPAVAAGHIAWQLRRLAAQNIRTEVRRKDDLQYAQTLAAIEAPFNVTETFLVISTYLLLVARSLVCIRRAIFVATMQLLCCSVYRYTISFDLTDFDPQVLPGIQPVPIVLLPDCTSLK
jgi:hypothetical protein